MAGTDKHKHKHRDRQTQLTNMLAETVHSCSAHAKRTLFSAKSARTLAHFIM